MLRVVLDTNVFVSSLLTKRGAAAEVLDAWRERRYLLIISPAIIEEIRRVLRYPRIQRKYAITDEDIAGIIELLNVEAVVVPGETERVAGAIPEDTADEAILACAVDGLADCIVSGDQHLLALEDFQGIPVWTVRVFLDHLSGQRETD